MTVDHVDRVTLKAKRGSLPVVLHFIVKFTLKMFDKPSKRFS